MPKSHDAPTTGGYAIVNAGKRARSLSGHVKNQTVSAMTVVRDAVTGRFLVGGTDERRLVNQHGSISVKPAPGKPKYFTQTEIETLTKLMKIA